MIIIDQSAWLKEEKTVPLQPAVGLSAAAAPCCIVFGAGRRQRHSAWTNAGWDFLSCAPPPKHICHRSESHREHDPARKQNLSMCRHQK